MYANESPAEIVDKGTEGIPGRTPGDMYLWRNSQKNFLRSKNISTQKCLEKVNPTETKTNQNTFIELNKKISR